MMILLSATALALHTKTAKADTSPEFFPSISSKTVTATLPVTDPIATYNLSIMAENMPQVLTLEISVKIDDTSCANITGYFKGADFTNLGFSIWTIGYWDKNNSDLQYLDAASSSPIDVSTPAEIFKIQIQVKNFDTAPVLVDIYEQYVGDVNGATLLSGDCPNDHTIYMNAVQITPLAIGGTYYNVTTLSNSSISQMAIDVGNMMLSFQTAGMDGTTGYVNVTIPQNFLNANLTDWIVIVDSTRLPTANATYSITSDSTNTYIYITYNQSAHQVHITGTVIGPEFPTITILATLLATITVAFALLRKVHKKRWQTP